MDSRHPWGFQPFPKGHWRGFFHDPNHRRMRLGLSKGTVKESIDNFSPWPNTYITTITEIIRIILWPIKQIVSKYASSVSKLSPYVEFYVQVYKRNNWFICMGYYPRIPVNTRSVSLDTGSLVLWNFGIRITPTIHNDKHATRIANKSETQTEYSIPIGHT